MILLEGTNFLKDYSDYIVLFPSVILGGIIAYWIYLKQKNIKELAYEKVSLNNIVKIDSKFRNSIEVKFNGEKVEKLWLLIIKIINSGNTPIEKKDFDAPISIELKSGNQILDVEIINKYPGNLQLLATHTSQKIELSPILLNAGDNYSIRVMISGAEPKYILHARISGVKDLKERNLEKQNSSVTKPFLDKSITGSMIAGLFAIVVSFITLNQEIFVTPEVEILNQNLYKSKNESVGNIELVPINSVASKKNLIYYKINERDELFRAVNQSGQWTIILDKYKENLIDGRNEVCYNFNGDSIAYKCLFFYIIDENK